MPKYTYLCSNCSNSKTQYVPASLESFPCGVCDSNMVRQFPSSGSQKVTEVVDSFTNVTQTVDQQQELAKRKEDYFWEVEVPRLVQHYSIETCLQEGWLVYNDKNELVINKPPSKR